VIDTDPHYTSGSHDVMTGVDGTAVQRPAFITYPGSASRFTTSTIKRFFFWLKTVSEGYAFISVVDSASKVYRFKEGTDADWTLIYTDVTSLEPFDYVVSNGKVYFSNGTEQKKYDGTTVTSWGIVAPATAPTAVSGGAGNVPAHIGHKYVYAYGVSTTGYISDISPVSAEFSTDNQDVDLTGARCADTQCDEVHIYRTEDGGATFYELSNSPIANPGVGTWALTDNDADISLNFASPAPLRGVNAPPPDMYQPTIFAGRIWGFKEDRVYFSTLEENNTSVPEECFGTTLTNSKKFGRTVTGIAATSDFLIVFTNRGIFRIGGDSLVTFTRSTLSKNLGLHGRQNIADFQGDAVWLDSSNTLRITDGHRVGKPDLTLPIRPDVRTISHSTSQVAVHDDGLRSWILLVDGANEDLYVFDVDNQQWMPPWNISGITAVGTNSVFINTIRLQIARSGRSFIMDEGSLHDNDVATGAAIAGYASELRCALVPLNEDNPTGINVVEYVGVERNARDLSDVAILMDEKPSTGTYVSLKDNEEGPDQRTNGENLVEKWCWNHGVVAPPGQRVSVKLTWDRNDSQSLGSRWELYSLDIVHSATK
jgi:hypothetical protein